MAEEYDEDAALANILRIALQPEEWMQKANCRGLDPNLFQLDQGQSAREPAKVCDGCTVTDECTEYAQRTHSVGVWGGRVYDLKKKRVKTVLEVVQDARPQKVSASTRRRDSAEKIPVQRIAASRRRT